MRILHVVPYAGWGGPHNSTLFLCKQFGTRGHESAVLLPEGANLAADRYRADGVPVLHRHIGRLRRRLDPTLHLDYAARFFFDAWDIRRLVKTQRWDVVTINGLTNPQTALGARWGGASLVWQLPDTDAPRPLGALARWLAGPNALFIAPARIVLRRYLPNPDRSPFGFVIPPPVQPRFFVEGATAWRDTSEPPVVGILSQLAPKKGPDVFLAAAKNLAQRYPEVTFVVAGATPPGFEWYEGQLARQAADLRTRVQFLGPLTDVDRVLRSLRVFVFPSRPGLDGLPTVILEAMACQTPIVATRVAGVPEVLTNESNALLVPPDDPAAMAGAVARLLDAPDFAQRLAQQAWQYACEHLEPEKTTEAYLSIYTRLGEHRR
jgi:glycosyltransferase involved in cell wall biosynthesis